MLTGTVFIINSKFPVPSIIAATKFSRNVYSTNGVINRKGYADFLL